MLWGAPEADETFGWADLEPPSRVLDLGAGLGFFGRVLLDRFPGARVDGIDLDEEGLVHARRRAAHEGLRRRLTFELDDAEALTARDDSYDLVTTHAVLVHQPRPDRTLREAFRVLRPGGRILLVEPDVKAAFEALDPAALDPWPELIAGAGLCGAGDWGVAGDLESRLREAGFDDVRSRRHPGRFRMPDPALRGHLAAVDPEGEEAHLELLGALHAAGGGSPELWEDYSTRLGVSRRARNATLDQLVFDRWGGLHVAVGRRV